jgi:hypothetical protein
LDKYCKENNVSLLHDYSNVKIIRDIYIKGNCCYNNCNGSFEKKFRELLNAGRYCSVCIQIVRNNRRKHNNLNNHGIEEPTKLYTIEKLNKICADNNIKLLEKYSEKVNGNSIIEGKCLNCINNNFKRTLHLCTFKTPIFFKFFILFSEYNKKLIYNLVIILLHNLYELYQNELH